MLMYSVLILNHTAIQQLDDKTWLALFALVETTEEGVGKNVILSLLYLFVTRACKQLAIYWYMYISINSFIFVLV